MAYNQGIQIDGLKEFRASLKAMDGNTPHMIKDVFNVSALLVQEGAQRRAPVRTGRLRSSIRIASTTTMAQVREGGRGVEYAGFIDYGGTVGRARYTARYKAAKKAGKAYLRAPRVFIPTGRILYPAFLAAEAQVRKAMQDGLTKLGAKYGVVVNENGPE